MEEMQRIALEVQGLRHAVFGNGKRGLVVQVEDLDETLTSVAVSVKALADEAAAERHMREGSRRTLQQIRVFAIAILGVLSAGGTWLFATLQTLAQDLGPLLP